MNQERSSPWLIGMAWLTLLSALLPIGMGAVVTTVDAGMAFRDWPTSDGIGLLTYPWLKSTGDKFLEHGHRLAGMVTGIVSIALVVTAFAADRRGWVRWLAVLNLLGVIAQGILGGFRVMFDERALAMIHGNFAAWVFSLMAVIVIVNRQSWWTVDSLPDGVSAGWVTTWSVLLIVTLQLQYLLGGMLRHLGSAHAWQQHPYFALVVMTSSVAVWLAARRTGSKYLSRWAAVTAGTLVAQVLLGVATWVYRYGVPELDVVAIQQTSTLTALRSLHKLVGVAAFMASVVMAVKIARVAGRPRYHVQWNQSPDLPVGGAV